MHYANGEFCVIRVISLSKHNRPENAVVNQIVIDCTLIFNVLTFVLRRRARDLKIHKSARNL